MPIQKAAEALLVTPMTSHKTSLKNTGWRRHTAKINLAKSDISPDWLYHSRSRFSKKLMVIVGVSWSGKTCLFIDLQKTQVAMTRAVTLHWSVEVFLTVWMTSTLSGQWLWIPARQCSVTLRKSDATVSMTEHSRLHSCWWMGLILYRLD